MRSSVSHKSTSSDIHLWRSGLSSQVQPFSRCQIIEEWLMTSLKSMNGINSELNSVWPLALAMTSGWSPLSFIERSATDPVYKGIILEAHRVNQVLEVKPSSSGCCWSLCQNTIKQRSSQPDFDQVVADTAWSLQRSRCILTTGRQWHLRYRSSSSDDTAAQDQIVIKKAVRCQNISWRTKCHLADPLHPWLKWSPF